MAAKTTRYSLIAAIALLVSAGTALSQSVKSSGSFTIDVKATAGEQYAYASGITTSSPDVAERNDAIIRSVAALEVIPKRWPNNRGLTIRAYGEIVSRLNGARLYENAIDFCEKAIAYVGHVPQRLPFIAAKGRALMWLDRSTEAQQAVDEAVSGAGFESLSDSEKIVIFRDAGFFYERQGNYRVAAQHVRASAKYTADELLRAEALRKALDLSLMAKDYASARGDLSDLSDAALKARMHNLQPPEQDLLRRIDAAILEYRKKVGG